MNSYRTHLSWISLVVMVVVAGCDSGTSSGGGSDMDALAAQLDQAKQVEANAKAAAEAAAAKAAADKQAAEEAAREVAAQQTAEERARAESTEFNARSGRRGQSFHGQGGYLNAVFSARFTAENQMTINMIKHNLDLFEATNSRYPKSQEEFFQAIITDGGVTLPELREGEEYWYDVENHELMVRTPTGEDSAMDPP